MLTSIQQQIGLAVFAAVLVAAFVFGRRDERAGAAIITVSALATLVHPYWEPWLDLRVGALVIDGLTLAALAWLVAVSDRRWPLFATAFVLLLVLLHLAALANPPALRITYLDAAAALGYGALAALAAGTWAAWRSRREIQGKNAWWSRAESNR